MGRGCLVMRPHPRVFLAKSAEECGNAGVEVCDACRGVWKLSKRKKPDEQNVQCSTLPPVSGMCVSGKELRAGIAEVLVIKGLQEDDFGQKSAKCGSALEVVKGKELIFSKVYFMSEYTSKWVFVNRQFLSVV
jgi:hypothetical protein